MTRTVELTDVRVNALGSAALSVIRGEKNMIRECVALHQRHPDDPRWVEYAYRAARRLAQTQAAYCALVGLTPSFFVYGAGAKW